MRFTANDIEKTYNKIKQGDLYRMKHHSDIFIVSKKNSVLFTSSSGGANVVGKRYTIRLKSFEAKTYPGQKFYVTLETLSNKYIRLSKKQTATMKVLFGKSKG